jgi:hypothetical protein
MRKLLVSVLVGVVGIFGAVGCSAEAEGPEEGVGDQAKEENAAQTSEDALTFYKKFEQRMLCRTTPKPADEYCKSKGYDGGSMTVSSCYRIDDFTVKDVTYTCRVRT